jgi:signal peptidase II
VRLRVGGAALVGVTLFVAGGASNWIDRVARGSVVDFLSVGVGSVRTGIFNVADVAIMLGAAVMLIAEIRAARRPT